MMIKLSELSHKVDWLEKKIKNISSFTDDQQKNIIPQKTEEFSFKEKEREKVKITSKENILIQSGNKNWLSEDWLLKIGAILLLLSFSWFIRYAFINNWVSEKGRIYLGLASGFIFLFYGWHQLEKQIHKQRGNVFAILGSSFVILSMFAAREIYYFFTPEIALGVMFFAVLAISVLGVFYKNTLLSVIGFVVSAILPFLLNVSPIDIGYLFSYLLIITFGAILVDSFTEKPLMSTLALITYILYSIPFFMKFVFYSPERMLSFVYIFSGIFLILSIIHSLKKNYFRESYGILLYVSTFSLLAWLISFGDIFGKTSLQIWMFVYLIASISIYFIHRNKNLFFLYLGPFIATLGVFSFFQYKGDALIIALILEIVVLIFAFFAFFRNLKEVRILSFLFIIPIFLSFKDLSAYNWDKGVIHSSFFVLFILAIILLLVGLLFSLEKRKFSQSKEEFILNKKYAQIGIILSSLYIYALIWLSLHSQSLAFGEKGTVISLIIYTFIALIVYFYGFFSYKKDFSLYGKVMLIIIIIRLLIVDVWYMDFPSRIITFFVIGILLIATTFIKKKKELISVDS